MDVYRPIGMEWFEHGFWAINDQEDTARQFLALESQPKDGTPALNESVDYEAGEHIVLDPGGDSEHRACTLDYFKTHRFDYVIASIPAHIKPFERLIRQFNPHAKLIVQLGNEWPEELFAGHNVLASIKPREFQDPRTNACFYHQEFDTNIFYPAPVDANKKVYSFINILQNMPLGWSDFSGLEMLLKARAGFEFKSFGGQCRDGNMTGPAELADMMREAMLVFHVKDGGDGYGHIIYNAYAVGRPVITRSRFYKDRLAEELLVPGTFIDLDKHNMPEAMNLLNRLRFQPDVLLEMGQKAHQRFQECVSFQHDSEEVRRWLTTLH